MYTVKCAIISGALRRKVRNRIEKQEECEGV